MGSTAEDHPIEFRVLGPFELAVGGRTLEIGSPKQRTVLAMLVLDLNRVVPLDAIVEELWPERSPASAVGTVQSLVSRLRHVLTPAGDGTGAVVLRGREPGYVLEADPAHVDARRFEEQLARGRSAFARGDPSVAVTALRQALDLWRGPALADLADRAFARLEASRLDEARLVAVEELAEAELALGLPAEALARLEPHVAAHPLREQAWGHFMVALYRLGRQAEALRAYQQVRHILGEELGVEPTPWLRNLEEQILLQRPEVDGPGPVPAAKPERDPVSVTSQPQPPGEAAPRHNFPVALTPFVGRVRELQEVREFLLCSRLLSLTGVGGVGKTRLALEAASGVLDDFPDGAWFVELAALSDAALVPGAVTVALGIEMGLLGAPGAPEDRLCDYLQTRRLLLVLDNCEHVVEEAARLAHAVLARCPEVTVLATSREVLGLPGEVVWSVPPLSVPPPEATSPEDLDGWDAVALFCGRAGAAQPGFGLSAANAAPVAHICRRLDGIPLALELAAARIRVLGAHRLADRLEDRFTLLTGGTRTAIPRHQTLRATMEWSYHLLPAIEQVTLRRLAVFPDSFDLQAAEAVVRGEPGDGSPLGPGSEILDLVSHLVDKSLVVVQSDEGDVRYRLLETVRQYAGERLAEAGETTATHCRHRDYFLGLARQEWDLAQHGWDLGHWMRRAATDEASFRSALEWSLNEGDEEVAVELAGVYAIFWWWAGRPEGRGWLERALAMPGRLPMTSRVEALVGLGLLVRSESDISRSDHLLEEALELALQLGEPVAVARVRFFLGVFALAHGKADEAEQLLESALCTLEQLGPSPAVQWPHLELGWVALALGDRERASKQFEQALGPGDHQELVDDATGLHALAALAQLVALAGDHQRAELLAEQAVAGARTYPLRVVLVMALSRAAETAILGGDLVRAEIRLRELLGLLRDLRAQRWVADALEMAAVLVGSRDPEAAARLFGASDTLRDLRAEPPGGVRPLSDIVRASRREIPDKLGDGGFAEQETQGRRLSAAEAISAALDQLGAR